MTFDEFRSTIPYRIADKIECYDEYGKRIEMKRDVIKDMEVVDYIDIASGGFITLELTLKKGNN